MDLWIKRIWRCVTPLIAYVTVNLLVSFAVVCVLLTDAIQRYGMEIYTNDALYNEVMTKLLEEVNAKTLLITALISGSLIPVLLWMHYRDHKKMPIRQVSIPVSWWGVIVVLGCALCVALNGFVSLTPMAVYFEEGYQETAEAIYGSSIYLQIIAVAILAPISEELIFRGLIYKRMRVFLNAPLATVVSAAIFGAFHGNMLQFIYATLLGVALAYVYERFRTVMAPIMVHVAANAMSVLISNHAGISRLIGETQERMLVAVLICSLISAICFYILHKVKAERKGNSNETVDNCSAVL